MYNASHSAIRKYYQIYHGDSNKLTNGSGSSFHSFVMRWSLGPYSRPLSGPIQAIDYHLRCPFFFFYVNVTDVYICIRGFTPFEWHTIGSKPLDTAGTGSHGTTWYWWRPSNGPSRWHARMIMRKWDRNPSVYIPRRCTSLSKLDLLKTRYNQLCCRTVITFALYTPCPNTL